MSSLSYVEQRLALARLIWNFDLTNADDAHEWDSQDNMKNMKAYSTWQKPGLRVRAHDGEEHILAEEIEGF